MVLGQYLLETEPEEAETVVQRRQREEAAARRAAVLTLQCELNGTVTALLLCCELALEQPELSATAAESIESAHGLVKRLRAHMESTLAEV